MNEWFDSIFRDMEQAYAIFNYLYSKEDFAQWYIEKVIYNRYTNCPWTADELFRVWKLKAFL